jgi:DTW domain-containing protein YfiP
MKPDPIASPPGRCYDCFRPQAACFCHAIPRIDNRTEVLIVQHRRERFHPFNTARIVRQALRNSHLVADHTCNLAARLRLLPRAGLLYPGPSARLISELTADEIPQQLVILDGTWHHAKTLLREIPAIRALPRYRLAPLAASRYRIRRAPNASALCTLEAAVAALRILEPQTPGFDQLLQAFDTMVEGQLAHPGSARRFQLRRNRSFKNVPRALLGDLQHIVVAYGEAAAGQRGGQRAAGPPISWIAQRLGSGETFSCTLTPPRPLDDVFLGHLALQRADFAAALSLDEARLRWAQFQRPTDIVTVIQPGTARLFAHLAGGHESCLVLKSVDLDPFLKPSLLEYGSFNFGRAGVRLTKAIALVRHLNTLANASSHLS